MKRVLDINQFLHGGDYNPEQWWDEPDVINQDFALFKQAKINTVTVGIFSWPKLEPQEENYDFSWLDEIFDLVEEMNGHVILATPSGARPAWLAQKYPEVLRTDNRGNKRGFGGRHNHCLTSPIYRKKFMRLTQNWQNILVKGKVWYFGIFLMNIQVNATAIYVKMLLENG